MTFIQPFQLAIANAVLEHLITQVKCKTLFITHYPQIGKELEAKAKLVSSSIVLLLLVLQYPTEVSNAHMGFIEEEKIGEPPIFPHAEHFLALTASQKMATGRFTFCIPLPKESHRTPSASNVRASLDSQRGPCKSLSSVPPTRRKWNGYA
jgi:hypothetical protein